MRSMTGFGRAEGFRNELKCGFKVEISSINKKQYDLKISMPKELAANEMDLRSFVAEQLSRGAVSLRIEVIQHGEPDSRAVDFSRAAAILSAARRFQAEHQLPGEITISDILAIPDAAAIQMLDLGNPEIFIFLKQIVKEAIGNLLDMREKEGINLERDILSRISVMEELVTEIEPLAAQLPEIQKQKLLKRLKDLELTADCNDERLLREAVIYGDKLDVSEEMTRLRSHFSNFRGLVADRNNSVGRSLDFMVQEIFRECNTLGNKAASTEISPRIVALKTELEKIREQVQNID